MLDPYELKALRFLAQYKSGWFTSGAIAVNCGDHRSRSQMAVFRHYVLLPLYKAGLIDKIDGEKPSAWSITDAGRAALADAMSGEG